MEQKVDDLRRLTDLAAAETRETFSALGIPSTRLRLEHQAEGLVGERTRPDIPTTDVEVDGVAETWYDDGAAMERANASPEAKALHADGALFIGRIKSFITEEKVIIPRE